MKKNIVIVDAYSSIHIGNGFLLDKSLCAIKSRYPGDKISIISLDKENIQHTEKVVSDIFSSFPRNTNRRAIEIIKWLAKYVYVFFSLRKILPNIIEKEFVRTIRGADVLISISGETINSNFFPRFFLRFLLIYRLRKKKIIIYPQSIGPIRKKHVFITKILLSHSESVYARDGQSYKVAVKELGLNNAEFCPDVAVTFIENTSYIDPTNIQSYRKKIIGITISNTPREIRENFPLDREIFNAIENLDKESYEVRIFPSNYTRSIKSDDYLICERLYISLRNHGIAVSILDNRLYSVEEFVDYIQAVDLMISSRMHVMILSTALLVPVISINTQYKIKEFNHLIGNDDYVVDYDQVKDIYQLICNFSDTDIEKWKSHTQKEMLKLNDIVKSKLYV